jgi:hypothetical protein
VNELIEPLVHILADLLQILVVLLGLLARYALVIAWVAWWLCGANWKKLWPVLAQGAWAPLVLLMVAAAMVWAQIAPSNYRFLGMELVNFWWQLGAVGLIVGLALFCGWLQGRFGWTPAEIDLEPPAPAAMEGHGHH